ncbi:MAG: hypothetical protein FGM22_07380 [Burkholderiaceae bacterium]|nr:hypothetical protein [Burkholderiaceae bacterium]
MSTYAQSLNDIDLTGFVNSAYEGVKGAANELVANAEAATKDAAAGAVRSGEQAVSREINRLVSGGGTSPAAPTLPATQSAETPVPTQSTQAGAGLGKYAIPAAVGVGVYLWHKSVLWAAGAAFAAWWFTNRTRKGGR